MDTTQYDKVLDQKLKDEKYSKKLLEERKNRESLLKIENEKSMSEQAGMAIDNKISQYRALLAELQEDNDLLRAGYVELKEEKMSASYDAMRKQEKLLCQIEHKLRIKIKIISGTLWFGIVLGFGLRSIVSKIQSVF